MYLTDSTTLRSTLPRVDGGYYQLLAVNYPCILQHCYRGKVPRPTLRILPWSIPARRHQIPDAQFRAFPASLLTGHRATLRGRLIQPVDALDHPRAIRRRAPEGRRAIRQRCSNLPPRIQHLHETRIVAQLTRVELDNRRLRNLRIRLVERQPQSLRVLRQPSHLRRVAKPSPAPAGRPAASPAGTPFQQRRSTAPQTALPSPSASVRRMRLRTIAQPAAARKTARSASIASRSRYSKSQPNEGRSP